jgi:putative tryptophan/tyrosine transport system substrate-binding protein
MRRRTFITLLGSAAAAGPLAARAQQGERVRRIGVPSGFAENDPEGRARVAAFQEGLQKLGWTEGRNVGIDVRWGTTEAATMQRLASELVAQQPDLIVTQNSPGAAP